jgi:addiction module HigA family antidote
MPMQSPPHRGERIRTEVIEALELAVARAAKILKVRRATLSDLLHAKASLTPGMALRIGKAFGPDMDHPFRMQLAYDEAKTRQQARGISVQRYAPAWSESQAPSVEHTLANLGRASSWCPFPKLCPTPMPRLGKIQFPKLPFDRISLCFPFRDPLIGAGLEKIERQCPAVEHFVVEGANIEL